jgi:hypothetical protein
MMGSASRRLAMGHPPAAPRRPLPAMATRASSTAAAAPAPVRDFFLDNLGKIFLGVIAVIIGSLVRSSQGTNNRNAVRDQLEEDAALDPLEIDDLRRANPEMTLSLFRMILQELATDDDNNNNVMTYGQFVTAVRTIQRREQGPTCTVGFGYLLDRVALAALQKYYKLDTQITDDAESSPMVTESASFGDDPTEIVNHTASNELTMPLAFWMTLLSLALHGPVPDRIRALYEVLLVPDNTNNNNNHDDVLSSNAADTVSLDKVVTLVGYLQDTCQLVPDKQVVPTNVQYPTQQYQRGTPQELVAWEAAAAAANSQQQQQVLDIDAFADILRSKSVCAWGECYFQKKYVP